VFLGITCAFLPVYYRKQDVYAVYEKLCTTLLSLQKQFIKQLVLAETGEKSPKWKRWLIRFGWAGFLFFLIKGIIWLLAGYFIFNEVKK
jgi:hypothetical protein